MNTPPPWYRQFWPWFLIGLPGVVVVASLYTWWIAVSGADHLVADDYYKDGLAINREIYKQQLAEELGISAQLSYAAGIVEVVIEGNADAPALRVDFSHALDADSDFSVNLPKISRGLYRARITELNFPRWLWHLEPVESDPNLNWRIDGLLVLDSADGS